MTQYVFDEIDHKIIDVLFEDGRISNRKLAAKLGFNEGTIRARIKRLEEEKLIRFTAVTNYEKQDRAQLASISINVEQGSLTDVIAALKQLAEIGSVIQMFGRYDIIVMGLFKDLADVHDVATNTILKINGVQHVETAAIVKVTKYDNRVARIV